MGDRKTIMWHQSQHETNEQIISNLKVDFYQMVFKKLKAHLSTEDLVKYEAMLKSVEKLEKENEELYEEYGDEWFE